MRSFTGAAEQRFNLSRLCLRCRPAHLNQFPKLSLSQQRRWEAASFTPIPRRKAGSLFFSSRIWSNFYDHSMSTLSGTTRARLCLLRPMRYARPCSNCPATSDAITEGHKSATENAAARHTIPAACNHRPAHGSRTGVVYRNYPGHGCPERCDEGRYQPLPI